MGSGSPPASAKLWNRARGRKPSAAATDSSMISTADAPSVSGEELPAVILHSICGNRAAIASFAKEVGIGLRLRSAGLAALRSLQVL